MAKFRNEKVDIETIKGGCPICHSDVKGNDVYLFFCNKCNILYKRQEIGLPKEHVMELTKKKIVEKYTRDKDKIRERPEKIPLKDIKDMPERKKVIIEPERHYFMSKKSNVVHASNCPYAKNIKQENRIIIKSLDNKYKKCRCVY